MPNQRGVILPLVLFGSVALLSGIGLVIYFFAYRPQVNSIQPLSTPNIGVEISDFESCVAAGNPVQESYPRRCIADDGESFTEVIADFNDSSENNIDDSANWKTYASDQFNFSFKYPQEKILLQEFSLSDKENPATFRLEYCPSKIQSDCGYGSSLQIEIVKPTQEWNFEDWINESEYSPARKSECDSDPRIKRSKERSLNREVYIMDIIVDEAFQRYCKAPGRTFDGEKRIVIFNDTPNIVILTIEVSSDKQEVKKDLEGIYATFKFLK